MIKLRVKFNTPSEVDQLANRGLKSRQTNQMADLQFVDFALIPGRIRKGNQLGLLEDFSIIDVNYSLTDEPSRVRFSRVFAQHGLSAEFNRRIVN